MVEIEKEEYEKLLSLKSELETLKRVQKNYHELEASQIINYHFSGAELLKLSEDHYQGSGIVVKISSLSGITLVKPFLIKNGLSSNSINSLLDDMQKSFDLAIEFKPMTKRLK